MGGGGTSVTRDEIHSLVLKDGSSTLGNYNPLTGDVVIDISDGKFHSYGAFNVKTSTANEPLELFTVDVPRNGIYIVSLLCHIRPTVLAPTKTGVIFSMFGRDGTGLLNTTRENMVDDSEDFDQPFELTVVVRLKSGSNTLYATFPGAYSVFGDRWSVTSV